MHATSPGTGARNRSVAVPPPSSPRRLSDAEFACVQAHCARVINDILRLGLSVHVETDFHAFARYRKSVGDGFCYPSFDPTCCRIAPSDFWLRVVDDAGDIVAAQAARFFDDVEDFYHLMRSETLWYDRMIHEVGRCRPNCTIPPFGGVVAHNGGMWVSRPHRLRGLAKLLPALSRGLQLRNHSFDFDTGLVFERIAQVALTLYQYPRCELVIDGYFPPTGKSERVYLCHMSRDEALRSVGFAAVDEFEPLGEVA